MLEFTTRLLFRPETAAQRFLPEGPYPVGDNNLSWVAIQHGKEAQTGSLNLLNLSSRTNQRFDLPGRPGFAFPTSRDSEFVIGLERQLGLFNTKTGAWNILQSDIDNNESGTIINDGVAFNGGLVFGCKDLKFAEQKAGLYLWRRKDRQLIQLRNDQICSNGKVILGSGDRVTMLDIDSPKKTVVRYDIDVARGTATLHDKPIVDLRSGSVFPDGMIATPDGKGVIIAFYNPADVDFGEARQYSLSGELEAVWKTERSPRVTCPQLLRINGSVKLVLTTADEGMSPEQQSRHTNAGCLLVGDANFNALPDTPIFNADGL